MPRGRKPKRVDEFQITTVNYDDVDWTREVKSRYLPVYEAVKNLRIGEALSCVCNSKSLGGAARAYAYKHCKGVYVIKAKYNPKTNVWHFAKVSK